MASRFTITVCVADESVCPGGVHAVSWFHVEVVPVCQESYPTGAMLGSLPAFARSCGFPGPNHSLVSKVRQAGPFILISCLPPKRPGHLETHCRTAACPSEEWALAQDARSRHLVASSSGEVQRSQHGIMQLIVRVFNCVHMVLSPLWLDTGRTSLQVSHQNSEKNTSEGRGRQNGMTGSTKIMFQQSVESQNQVSEPPLHSKMAHVGTVFTSSVLCFVADAAPRPGPDEVMNFKAHQVLHLFDLISLVQVCQTTPIARARAREVMTRLRLEAMERLRISLPKLPSMGRVVFHLVCPEPAFAFRAMGSMLELGKVFHLGGAVAKKAERAAAFLEGLYERSCRLMRVREAMFLDTVGVVQAEIAEPPKEEDRLILDIEDYLFDYGALAVSTGVFACRLVMSGSQ